MSSGYGMPPGQPAGPVGAPAQPQVAPRPAMGGPPLSAGGGSPLSQEGLEKAQSLRWWMKLMGIVSIIVGAFYCVSLAGVVFGWLPILLGYWMMKAGDGIGTFAETGDAMSLENGIRSLRAIYMAAGISFLVGIGLSIIFVIIYFVVIVGMVGAAGVMSSGY